jgi:succinate dehydrogenase / fumarate reductase, membrane anchor subunit
MSLEAIPRRDLGSSGQGTAHWWLQRVSAIALVPLLVWFVVAVVSVPVVDPPSVIRWIRGGMHALLLLALILAAAQHSYLGTRVIVEDYVSDIKARVATLVILQFMHIALAGAGILSVLRVALGAEP